ncbi:MAG TPA: peptidylprolyl isomerase [Nanoarchaeota archaeon]|nr:peptidylprolyl isomerase [Candidatus Pacearchaeota archaeon]HIH17453.1 peptidylprolyl isomerase [Nanoarchaeota archaeon]HIH33964.1 peptidylprolyl isomerase [Nanoarchaeota archaeon]HIH51745.1 peptidylprolyl isomerase [Nanoarchaeota archaeon]HIH66683.1 peptidylprolyl isomerase [Nanoarchaeota archaeon]
MEKVKEKDFIELEFTAKTEEGKVFDTTNKKDAKEAGLPADADYAPVKLCVGEGQLLRGLDKQLIGKEVGKGYEIQLSPEEAFGQRDSKLVKIIPLKVFHEKQVNPYPGLALAIDNLIATVRAVSGGRVITDFNHPFAGKKIFYDLKILRKIDEDKEKIGILLQRYARTDKFSLKEHEILLEKKLGTDFTRELEKKIKELVGDFKVKEDTNVEKEAARLEEEGTGQGEMGTEDGKKSGKRDKEGKKVESTDSEGKEQKAPEKKKV